MCERISWIELPDKTLLYLTTYDLWDTPEGKKIREQLSPKDWWGHSAIKMFYGKRPGIDIGWQLECTDYSKPENFPPEIARAIKDGRFRDVCDARMLTRGAESKLAKVDAASGKLDAAQAKLDAAWDKLKGAAAKFNAAVGKFNPAVAKLDAAGAKMGAAQAKLDAAWGRLHAAQAKLDAARAASSNPFPVFWKLFGSQRNRALAWRDRKTTE